MVFADAIPQIACQTRTVYHDIKNVFSVIIATFSIILFSLPICYWCYRWLRRCQQCSRPDLIPQPVSWLQWSGRQCLWEREQAQKRTTEGGAWDLGNDLQWLRGTILHRVWPLVQIFLLRKTLILDSVIGGSLILLHFCSGQDSL